MEVKKYFECVNAGVYSRAEKNKKLRVELNQVILGTVYWRKTDKHKYLTELLRHMPTDKAIGPDNLSDRWMRRKKNA